MDAVGTGGGDIAAVEIQGDVAIAGQVIGTGKGGLTQAGDKIHADCIVIIQTELQGGVLMAAHGIDRGFHHLAMWAGVVFLNFRLGDTRQQINQTIAIDLGQVHADHNKKGEIGIGLGTQGGQGEAFEVTKPFLHAFGGIEIGGAFGGVVVMHLKSAQCGI